MHPCCLWQNFMQGFLALMPFLAIFLVAARNNIKGWVINLRSAKTATKAIKSCCGTSQPDPAA